MKLSHHTKVTVRKALAALRTLDQRTSRWREEAALDRQESALDTARRPFETAIVKKAGFPSRKALEKFASQHHLKEKT
jgi:hypothetical protein